MDIFLVNLFLFDAFWNFKWKTVDCKKHVDHYGTKTMPSILVIEGTNFAHEGGVPGGPLRAPEESENESSFPLSAAAGI